MERRDFDYYEARAQGVKLADITSCEYNTNILSRLRDKDSELRELDLGIDIDPIGCVEDNDTFDVDKISDIGWLGYFIGKSKNLKILLIQEISSLEGEREKNIEAFIEGLNCNRSIVKLHFNTDLSDVQFQSLSPFFRNNSNLADLELYDYEVGLECAQSISLTLAESQYQSLKKIAFQSCNLSDEGLAEITTALRACPQLEELDLASNNIGLMGCIALREMMRGWGMSSLKRLNLSYNAIGDEELQTLAAGLANTALEELSITGNNLLTGAGLRSLSTFLQSESCCLRSLVALGNAFGDEGAVALADGLAGNKSLERLYFDSSGITDVGRAAFSKLLCDPLSINSTYLSNHNLLNVGDVFSPKLAHLEFNKHPHPAIQKILCSHPDLDMEPFFQWKLKLLPVVINWFKAARARLCVTRESVRWQSVQWTFKGRELSAVYKFVRAMPALATVSYWQQFVANAQLKRRRIDDERRRLESERSRLYHEEEAAWVRLGGRPSSEGEGRNTNVNVVSAKRRRQE